MELHKIYKVRWRDHFSTAGWSELADLGIVDEVILETVGFFVREDKHYYHFAQTIGDDICAEIMSVLKKQVLSLVEIKYETTIT